MTSMVADPAIPPVLPHPPAPRTLDESGLPVDLVLQLVLKTLHFSGDLAGHELAGRLGVRVPVIEPAIDLLKRQHHIEVIGGSMLGVAAFRYRITDAGRSRAALFLEHSHYVGVAPVPLDRYQAYLRHYARVAPRTVTRERVARAFSHLVISDRVLDQLGPAVNAGHSLFVYGPPGNGKTVIAQGIRALLDGDLAVPHAIEVEGQIIRIFDPSVHASLPVAEDTSIVVDTREPDMRWARCRRPLVVVGGELTLAQLELSYDPIAGFYRAPVQALANGGVLVIDDFGRQACAPRDLLNRWIVPLESRVDFLTLHTGKKFDLPFLALVAFATNLAPADLVDEAFLRRIRYKVFAESPTVDDFARIFRNVCDERGMAFDRGLVDHLIRSWLQPRRIPLRGCQPRDLVDHALALAEYRGEPRHLTPALLEAACASYFVDDREPAPRDA
jgi:predicted ATPase with chaperone activity